MMFLVGTFAIAAGIVGLWWMAYEMYEKPPRS
jgi:hypothetical protein